MNGASRATKIKTKRSHLTLEQQYKALKWCGEEKGRRKKEPKRDEVIAYVEEQFNMTVSTGFVSGLKKRKRDVFERFLGSSDHEGAKKKDRKSSVVHLNKVLALWVTEKERQRAPLTDTLLTEKAKELGPSFELPNNFNYSSKWLLNFKKSVGMSCRALHGEGAAANLSGVKLARERLPDILQGASLEDIYNMDETGLLYRTLPTRAIMTSKRKGGKCAKDRFTLNLFANASGSDVFLQAIGTAAKPRCFGKNFVPERNLRIPYYSNKKGWMTGILFNKIIRKFK